MNRTMKYLTRAALGMFLTWPATARVAEGRIIWAQIDANYAVCKRQVRTAERACKSAAHASALQGHTRSAAYRVCSKRAGNQLGVCKTRAAMRNAAPSSPSHTSLAGSAVVAADAGSGTAMVTTDKLDYHPLQIVTLAGVGWLPGETVSLVITEEPQTHDPVSLSSVADDNGDFINTDYTVQFTDIGVAFTLTATGETSGSVAQTLFTDATAPGQLDAPSPCSFSPCNLNSTHWKVEAGTTITGTILGATDVSSYIGTGTCGADLVDVIIHSSDFGNTTVCGTVSGTTITFSWSVPATGVCNTTIVSYGTNGNVTNNSLIPHGNGNAAGGFAIVDSSGAVITSCEVVQPTPTATPITPPPCEVQVTACKYEDDNANGMNDGEPALAGWSMTIDPLDSAPEGATQLTDAAGCVTWTHLDCTTSHVVSEAAPSGGNPWFNTAPGSSGPCLMAPSGCPSPNRTILPTAVDATIEFGNIQSAELKVCKYEDLNANGANNGEPALSGWTVGVSGSTSGVGVTDTSGCASFFVLPIGNYQAAELLLLGPPAWFNTDPGQSGVPCLASSCPIPSKSGIPVSAGGSTEVDFGNLQSAEKHGQKFYDLNTDGSNNDGQSVAGLKITLTGTDVTGASVGPLVTYTDGSGNYSFINLLPSCATPPCPETGYVVTETKPNTTWINTTPTSITFGLDPGEVETGNNFGNVCVGAGGGLTLGFWSNKNGQALITATDLCTLNGMNLKNAMASNFDPVAGCPAPSSSQVSTGKTALKNWLLSANATNMAYMLSAQLTAMKLNVLRGFVSPSAMVFAGVTPPSGCNVPGLNLAGFISIANLIADADTASNHSLAIDAYTALSAPPRNCQEFMKNALDKANNNLNFVQGGPCHFTSPY